MGAVQRYEIAGEEVSKDFVLAYLSREEVLKELTESPLAQDSLACFFALDQTGDEKYRQMIEALAGSRAWTLDFMPFVTAYETRYKRKEHYNEIAALFRKEEQFTGSGLVALIETIGQMSEEIYEYYRELKDLFKTAVREKIKELPDSPEALEIGYSILKACNTGVLQRERYSGFGELIWKEIDSNDKDTCTGLQEMIKAQYTMLKKQEG
ncbi:MAG TPA: hypothetical protein DEQ64_20525 [Lachnoclostridium sp.]|jgi:hypothetical protein|nr:hypothetical protein [Lachnoclostridium sp.]